MVVHITLIYQILKNKCPLYGFQYPKPTTEIISDLFEVYAFMYPV
jgi:hypothetical protein